MIDQTLFASIQKPLSTAQSIFIFLPQNPSFDQVAASLSLFLSLKKTNKTVSLSCPSQMKVEYSDLFGIDKIKTEPSGRNLVVSFDYLEDSIEKVSYNIEDNKFNLVVQPKVGFPPLSPDRVAYNYTGGDADLIFTIGVRDLNDLGDLFRKSESIFDKQKIIDIDLTSKSKRFAQTEVILSASSFSEIVARLISQLSLPIVEDIATNLLLGIERATGNFSSPRVSAATFETAAFCLRAGGRRGLGQPRVMGGDKKRIPFKPMPAAVSAAKKPIEPIGQGIPEEPTEDFKWEDQKPSPDWLQPKIYKGNTRI